MPQKTLRFKIHQDGRVEETVEGFTGNSCNEATKNLEDALGKVTVKSKTSDAFISNQNENLKKLNQSKYDFVFYIAGVDIHHNDRLGKLKITDEGINKRDQIVIENFYSKNIPLCGVLGGGYNNSFDKLIELHSMLHKNCAEYF